MRKMGQAWKTFIWSCKSIRFSDALSAKVIFWKMRWKTRFVKVEKVDAPIYLKLKSLLRVVGKKVSVKFHSPLTNFVVRQRNVKVEIGFPSEACTAWKWHFITDLMHAKRLRRISVNLFFRSKYLFCSNTDLDVCSVSESDYIKASVGQMNFQSRLVHA